MGNIADKLQNIIDSKAAISAAIEAKGGTVPTELSGYGPAIEALPSGGGGELFKQLVTNTLNSLAPSDLNGITTIRNKAFMGASRLQSVNLPNTITSIGEQAFAQISISSIVIPNSVVTLGIRVFSENNILTEATIGNGLAVLNDGTFYNCVNLSSVTFEDNSALTAINSEAFRNTKIKSIEFPSSLKRINDTPKFSGLFYNSALTSVILNEGLEYIGRCFLYSTPNLSSIILPSTLTAINDNAFWRSSLHSIDIPDSVSSIGNSAIDDISQLTSVVIGSGLTALGSDNTMFNNCRALADITFRGKTFSQVQSMPNFPWKLLSSCVIHCSDGDYYNDGTPVT